MNRLEKKKHLLQLYKTLVKAPPGETPPMARKYGWEWDDEKHHWVAPADVNTTEMFQDSLGMAQRAYKDGDFKTTLRIMAYMNRNLQNFADNEMDVAKIEQFLNGLLDRVAKQAKAIDVKIPKKHQGLSSRGFTSEGYQDTIEESSAKKHDFYDSPSYKEVSEYESVSEYITEGYTLINAWLRGDMTIDDFEDDDDWGSESGMEILEDVKTNIEQMTAILDNVGFNETLYRGLDSGFSDIISLTEGDMYSSASFLSTSRDIGVAGRFAGSQVMFEIHTKPTTKAISVENLESETILGLNQKFRVKEIHGNVKVGEDLMARYIVLEAL